MTGNKNKESKKLNFMKMMSMDIWFTEEFYLGRMLFFNYEQ